MERNKMIRKYLVNFKVDKNIGQAGQMESENRIVNKILEL